LHFIIIAYNHIYIEAPAVSAITPQQYVENMRGLVVYFESYNALSYTPIVGVDIARMSGITCEAVNDV